MTPRPPNWTHENAMLFMVNEFRSPLKFPNANYMLAFCNAFNNQRWDYINQEWPQFQRFIDKEQP